MCSASPSPHPTPLRKYLTVVIASLLPFLGIRPFCLVFVLFVSRTDLQSDTLCRGKLCPESFKNVCTPLTEQKGMVAEDQSKCIFRGEMGCYSRGPEWAARSLRSTVGQLLPTPPASVSSAREDPPSSSVQRPWERAYQELPKSGPRHWWYGSEHSCLPKSEPKKALSLVHLT